MRATDVTPNRLRRSDASPPSPRFPQLPDPQRSVEQSIASPPSPVPVPSLTRCISSITEITIYDLIIILEIILGED